MSAPDDPPSDASVVVDTLVKRYPRSSTAAVDGVSFQVGRGEIFGLLGPNGAGKTTTIGVLTTRVLPTSGRAWVAGIDVEAHPVEAKKHLAVVPQRNNLDRSLSIRQNLLFHAAYHGVPSRERNRRATSLLEQFGLADRAKERVDMFSGGQTQRIMIARALMHSPGALFLDEPTTGLDPAARLFLWDRLRELRSEGVSVIITTHDMDEAAELSDRVGIVDHGHLLVLDTPEALTKTLPGEASLELSATVGAGGSVAGVIDDLEHLDRVERVEVVGEGGGPAGERTGAGRLRARLYLSGDPGVVLGAVAGVLVAKGVALDDLRTVKASLEDVFLHLTGRLLR